MARYITNKKDSFIPDAQKAIENVKQRLIDKVPDMTERSLDELTYTVARTGKIWCAFASYKDEGYVGFSTILD